MDHATGQHLWAEGGQRVPDHLNPPRRQPVCGSVVEELSNTSLKQFVKCCRFKIVTSFGINYPVFDAIAPAPSLYQLNGDQ